MIIGSLFITLLELWWSRGMWSVCSVERGQRESTGRFVPTKWSDPKLDPCQWPTKRSLYKNVLKPVTGWVPQCNAARNMTTYLHLRRSAVKMLSASVISSQQTTLLLFLCFFFLGVVCVTWVHVLQLLTVLPNAQSSSSTQRSRPPPKASQGGDAAAKAAASSPSVSCLTDGSKL